MGNRPNLPPGWPIGPEWPSDPPEPERDDLRWWITAGAVALVALVVGAVILATRDGSSGSDGSVAASTTPASASSASTTTSTSKAAAGWRLSQLLASQQMLSDHAGHAALTLAPVISKPFTNVTITPVECTSVVVPGSPGTYNISNMTGFAGQSAGDTSPDAGHKIIQVIAAFPTDDDATRFFDQQFSEWQRCTGTSMSSATADGVVTAGDVGIPTSINGLATVVITPTEPAAAGRSCQHAMTHRGTFVIDVRICAPNVGESGTALAQAISDRITR